MKPQTEEDWIRNNLANVFTDSTAAKAAGENLSRDQLVLLGNEMMARASFTDKDKLYDRTVEDLSSVYGSLKAYFLTKEFENKGVNVYPEDITKLLNVDPKNFTNDVRQMLTTRILKGDKSASSIIKGFIDLSQNHDMVKVAALIASGKAKGMTDAAQKIGVSAAPPTIPNEPPPLPAARWARPPNPSNTQQLATSQSTERNGIIDHLIKHYSEGNKLSRKDIDSLEKTVKEANIGGALNSPCATANKDLSCGEYLKQALADSKVPLVTEKRMNAIIADIDTKMIEAKPTIGRR